MQPDRPTDIEGVRSAAGALDEIAALFVQLEPEDADGIAKLREMVAAVAADEARSDEVREPAAKARRVLDKTIKRGGDPAEALKTVGPLVETMCAEASGAPDDDALPGDIDVQFVQEFISESRENIQHTEAALLQLETNPEDREAINVVFRAFHTMKGTSMWLGLERLAEFAHHAESLLSRMREGEIRCTGGYADLALRATDMLRSLVEAVHVALASEPLRTPEGYEDLMEQLANPEAAGISGDSWMTGAVPRLGDLLVAQGKADRAAIEAALANADSAPAGVAIVQSEAASLADVASALRTQQRLLHADRPVDSSVRVRTDRLDRLIDMVGELVIAHSMVAQDEFVRSGGHHDFLKKIGHAGKIVRELQDLGLLLRTVPLKATFQKVTRIVRDLAQKSGKAVKLIPTGEETEIDRNLVDVIGDPLIHMIRNAVDHGIEMPEDRERAGKPAGGTVKLSAYHSGGDVVIEMADDGKGLDRERILQKAISRGLVEPNREMTDGQVFALIFEPGFSTAEKLTEVSGRGVGMDVVKRSVESVKGRIEISSRSGLGTTFTIRLPLTLAIADGMLVRVGAERYIIPTVNIHVSFRPEASALSTFVGRGEVVRLRDELIPVFRLHQLFGVEGAVMDPTEALLVVVDDGEGRCALLVDELLSKQQVVAKSLGGIAVRGIAGAAILGDGRVGLILDPSALAALAREVDYGAEVVAV